MEEGVVFRSGWLLEIGMIEIDWTGGCGEGKGKALDSLGEDEVDFIKEKILPFLLNSSFSSSPPPRAKAVAARAGRAGSANSAAALLPWPAAGVDDAEEEEEKEGEEANVGKDEEGKLKAWLAGGVGVVHEEGCM